jgi:molybdate transport system substrate-binding protein
MYLRLITFLLFVSMSHATLAENVSVAVASNALKALQSIKKEFEKNTAHKLTISSGSTGKLYAQIINGAPFDVFLAANVSEPKRLEQEEVIVVGSRFTYAKGRLALCSTTLTLDEATATQRLTSANFNRLALANPKTAPYGAAAKEVLQKLTAWEKNKIKLIKGESISQAYQFTASGNVDMGFVALAQIWNNHTAQLKKCWQVPETYHSPLEQQAVWLKRAENNPAAKAFVDFLKSDQVKKILSKDFGYGV